jgi:hypothetical protein
MQTVPISAKEALARFNSSKRTRQPPPSRPSSSSSSAAATSSTSVPISLPSSIFTTPNNNLMRMLQDLKPRVDHYDCCAADLNLNSCHSDTCSACSESTASSEGESEEDTKKNTPGFGWAKKPKIKSNQRVMRTEARKEKSAAGLKQFVYDSTIMDFYDMQKKGCNDKCQHGQQCLKKVTLEYIGELREGFWGKRNDKPFKPKDRKSKIQDIYSTAMALKSGGVG